MSKFRPLLFQQMIIISLREPNASAVENEGYGYIVASVGELGGKAPYTSYNARSSYIKNNKEINAGKPHEYWNCKKITKNFKKNEKSACILFFVII